LQVVGGVACATTHEDLSGEEGSEDDDLERRRRRRRIYSYSMIL
jgi:hypothetical protein